MDLRIHKRVSAFLPKDASDKETIIATLGYIAGYDSACSHTDEVSYAQVIENKTDFARFLKAAAGSTSSAEYRALYKFLLKCFTDADKDFNGRIDADEFDTLIEIAANAPRRFGYAPATSDMYENDDIKRVARRKMFAAMDEEKKGTLGFDSWLGYCYDHIRHKAATLELSPEESPLSRNKESYITYMKAAIIKTTHQYKELYLYLLDCFTQADVNMDGQIGPSEFDMLIETAAATPRQFGLAPTTQEMYASAEDRILVRSEIFRQMDENHDGHISFDEWLKFSFAHIHEKVKAIR